jgi:hypothetical protein
MKNEIITVTAAASPTFSKLIGTWEVYNVTSGMIHLCRLVNGKRAAIAAKNMMNVTLEQFAELKAA